MLPYVQYKEEIHSISPRISLFLDVITDRQADMLKEKAFPGVRINRKVHTLFSGKQLYALITLYYDVLKINWTNYSHNCRNISVTIITNDTFDPIAGELID